MNVVCYDDPDAPVPALNSQVGSRRPSDEQEQAIPSTEHVPVGHEE